MHRDGHRSIDDLDWTRRQWNGVHAYCDSKLLVTTLAMAVAARWPGTLANAVDPGWVPTRMGGPVAPDDLTLGHRTQTWLAVSDEPAATVTGRYWCHQQPQPTSPAVQSSQFQDALFERLAELTEIELPSP
jgi:NAD(P)-dependent dehydrogenase (short-subunit alcohol dehydrogenase family)